MRLIIFLCIGLYSINSSIGQLGTLPECKNLMYNAPQPAGFASPEGDKNFKCASKYVLTGPLSTNSIEDCAEKCRSKSTCLSFSFNYDCVELPYCNLDYTCKFAPRCTLYKKSFCTGIAATQIYFNVVPTASPSRTPIEPPTPRPTVPPPPGVTPAPTNPTASPTKATLSPLPSGETYPPSTASPTTEPPVAAPVAASSVSLQASVELVLFTIIIAFVLFIKL